jgi:hypothetical protein
MAADKKQAEELAAAAGATFATLTGMRRRPAKVPVRQALASGKAEGDNGHGGPSPSERQPLQVTIKSAEGPEAEARLVGVIRKVLAIHERIKHEKH